MPLVTARQICEPALSLIGIRAAEQPVEAFDAQQALMALNSLIDAWSIERLLTYTKPKIPLILVPGQASYTWGDATPTFTPDIRGPSPVRLELCLLTVDSTPIGLEWPVTILEQDDYEAGIWSKALQSTYVEYVYLEQTEPVAILHCWPVPTVAHTLQLLPWAEHRPYEHWDHAIAWPSGYQRAFTYNLAVDLAPLYGVEAQPTVQRIAEESKRLLGNLNAQVGRLTSDFGGARDGGVPVADVPAFWRA